MSDDGEKMGIRFWLAIAGLAVGAVVAGVLVFVLFGHLWYAWGFFGAFLALCVVLMAFGWVVDRRERNRRNRLAA
jgi:membrane protein implicated in regulation of membrane protease activity